jgi:hypothetical protein
MQVLGAMAAEGVDNVVQVHVQLGVDQLDLDPFAKHNPTREEQSVCVYHGLLKPASKAVEMSKMISHTASVRFIKPGKRSRIGRGEVDALVTERGKVLDAKQSPTDLYRCEG